MKILIACEESGIVTKAFRERGFEAWSCDILPTSGDLPQYHIQDDIFNVLKENWDCVIAFPPCTYLTNTGNSWFNEKYNHLPYGGENRKKLRYEAAIFFTDIFFCKALFVAVENPVGYMSNDFRKPDQYIHPYHFGDNQSKKTGLWLRGLPPLKPTNIVEPVFHKYKDGRNDPQWHMETLKIKDRNERSKARSKTFLGIAKAMAQQWGDYLAGLNRT